MQRDGDSTEARERWGADGEEIARRLREEVAGFADVSLPPNPRLEPCA